MYALKLLVHQIHLQAKQAETSQIFLSLYLSIKYRVI